MAGKWTKILIGFLALIVILSLVGSILQNSIIGIIISIILLIIVAILIKNESEDDLVEIERKELIRVCKENKNDFSELYCVPNPEIYVNPKKSVGKILGHTLYGNGQNVFCVKTGLFKEQLFLIPQKLIYNPSKKELRNKVFVKCSGFLNQGIFDIPNSVEDEYLDKLNSAFTKKIDYRATLATQKALMKLVKIASGTDSNFLKAYKLKREDEFDASQ